MVDAKTCDRMQKLIAVFLKQYPAGAAPKPEVPQFCVFGNEIYLVVNYNVSVNDLETKFRSDVNNLNWTVWRVGEVVVNVTKDDTPHCVAFNLQWLQMFLSSSAPHYPATTWKVAEA